MSGFLNSSGASRSASEGCKQSENGLNSVTSVKELESDLTKDEEPEPEPEEEEEEEVEVKVEEVKEEKKKRVYKPRKKKNN